MRLEPDSPDVLDSIFRATFSADLRAIYVLAFSFIALIMLHKQVVVFSFGQSYAAAFTTELVFKKLSAAVIGGVLLGLGESALPSVVGQKSANLIAALGK